MRCVCFAIQARRVNEVLRLKWSQVNLERKTATLYASKTERDRAVPLSTAMVDLLKTRKCEGLASDEYVFARAITHEFDRQIARACRQAGKQAKIATAGSRAKASLFIHSDTPTLRTYSLTE